LQARFTNRRCYRQASPPFINGLINAAFIVLAVNSHDQLIAALKAISTHWANQYDHPNMEAPMYQGPYGTGVTVGHRACKAIADKPLALLDGKEDA
jgi:hypothetical protein